MMYVNFLNRQFIKPHKIIRDGKVPKVQDFMEKLNFTKCCAIFFFAFNKLWQNICIFPQFLVGKPVIK